MSLTYPDNINPAALSLLVDYLQEKRLAKQERDGKNSILELGCSTGALGLHLLRLFPHQLDWIGIDMNDKALNIASSRLTRTCKEDLNTIDEARLRSVSHSPHIVVMIDVLEHVYEPTRLLRTISAAYADALIVCILPNIACYQTYEKLCLHDFSYDESGIFDSTHRTFYTASSALNLFRSEGYVPVKGPIFLIDPPMNDIAATNPEFPFVFRSNRYSITLETREDLLSLSSYGFGFLFRPVISIF